MRSSTSKQEPAAEGKRGRSGAGDAGHSLSLLHQRLLHALSLGTRINSGNQRKWQCTDIETQRVVLRSISSFLDCVTKATSQHPLVKVSIADIVASLAWILQYKSEVIMSLAATVAVKVIRTIPYSLLESHLLDLVRPLSSLLSLNQLQASISSATALNLIITKLGAKKEEKIWEILLETQTISQVASNIRGFFWESMSVEFFQEMASLLGTILHRWPHSRYSVWSDHKLMKVLEDVGMKDDYSVKVAVLKVYSGIALCGYGTKNLLENGDAIIRMMVLCMGRSNPISVRIEGFKLAQCLAKSEEGCSKIMSSVGNAIVKVVIDGMSAQSSSSGKIGNEEMSLLTEVCSFALVLRWPGKHHDCFWEQQIDRVLLDLLLDKFHDRLPHHPLSLEEQISQAKEDLNSNFLLTLRPYIWDILGWLAIHCREDFNQNMHGQENLNLLLICACLCFVDSTRKRGQMCHNDTADDFRGESISRAVLMLMYSPSKYMAAKTRIILAKILKPIGEEILKRILKTLNIVLSRDNSETPSMLQKGNDVLALANFCALPLYQSEIMDNGGVKTLMSFIGWYLSNNNHTGGLSAPTLLGTSKKRTCCWTCQTDWEGDDALLLYGFWGLIKLLQSGFDMSSVTTSAGQLDFTETEFISILKNVCTNSYAPGLKWYAAYILSFFGCYGFPCKLGTCVGKALNENEDADMQLILKNGNSINVHGVILATRCPSLVPPEALDSDGNSVDGCSKRHHTETHCGRFLRQIRLSSCVDNQALVKLLEFVYCGYLHTGEELVKKLKVLAKLCKLQPLLSMLDRRRPHWGALFPSFGLFLALGPTGQPFSDVILEAKVTEFIQWRCAICSSSEPHIHAHRLVLSSRCEYLRALLHSGMQESVTSIVKVPVGLEALTKLVRWLYTDELPSLPFGCLWESMDSGVALQKLLPYLELCWLSELWFLEDVCTISFQVIETALDSARHLSVKAIKAAANLSLWKVAEIAAYYLAPLYQQLCQAGELEALDDELVDLIRTASVQLSQEVS